MVGILALCGTDLSALFMLRVVQRTFYGEKNPRWEHIPDVSEFLAVPRVILMSLFCSSDLFPKVMLDVIQSTVIPFVTRF